MSLQEETLCGFPFKKCYFCLPTSNRQNKKDMKKIIIAIDGFSSCGKSTMAKDLAKKIGYVYIDSGAMYRAVTLFCMESGLFQGKVLDEEGLKKRLEEVHITFKFNPKTGRPDTYLNGRYVEDKIRGMEVSERVSIVSALGFVRQEMVAQQQAIGQEKGIVMDGRDIGTAVFPEAEMKIFVTASAQIRALRRYDELKAKNQEASFEEILKNVQERDLLDQTRQVSPLRKADDALLLDNSQMSIEEQNQWLLDVYQRLAKED